MKNELKKEKYVDDPADRRGAKLNFDLEQDQQACGQKWEAGRTEKRAVTA